MTCTTTITSTSNTLKNLAVNESFHSSYIQTQFNDKKETIINIFSASSEPLLKDINHPELIQEWKINPDFGEYEKHIDDNLYKPSERKEIYFHDSNLY